MRLCTWFASIDLDSRCLTATLGFSTDDGDPRVLGSRAVRFSADQVQGPHYRRSVEDAIATFSEWFHLESGGALRSVALGVSGNSIQEAPASGTVQSAAPVLVDGERIRRAREQALERPRRLGPLVQSVIRVYELDGRRFREVPVGDYASSLRLELTSWIARSESIAPIIAAIESAGFEVGPIVARAEATAEAALTGTERRDGAVVISVGEDFSEVAAVVDSTVVDLFTVPLGRAPLMAELARACNVSVDVVDRLDLALMLDRLPSDPMVQRVRTVLSAWGSALFTGVRRRLDDRDVTIRLQAGVVIAGASHAFPGLDDSAARSFGTPARFAALQEHGRPEKSARAASPASLGLIALQAKAQQRAAERIERVEAVPVLVQAFVRREVRDRGGLGQSLGRWLREFVPANHD